MGFHIKISSLCFFVWLAGCADGARMDFPTTSDALQEVTLSYQVDVSRIFQTRCFMCHAAGRLNWTAFENILANKDRIKQVIQSRQMPLNNQTNMTPKEREIVIQWIDEGARP
jgi:uncharacterized membrane protein